MSWNVRDNFGHTSPLWSNLAFRLTAWYLLAGLALVVLTTASLYFLLVTELKKSTDLFLADKINVVRTMLQERPDDQDGLREEIELESAARTYQHFYIRLLDERNTPLLVTPGMEDQLDLSQLSLQTLGRAESVTGRNGRPFLVMSSAAHVGNSGRTDTVQIAIDISQQEALLASYRQRFWVILFGTLAIYPLIGYQIARRGIRPLREVAMIARQISSTNLHERIQAEGYPSELASLAATFNKMLDGLEESFQRISRFSTDIAHDLRTPVNNIRGEAEVALARARTVEEYREVLGSCLEEAVRLSDLIGDLLFLARAESPLAYLHRESINVGDLLSGIREYYEASASDRGISLSTVVPNEPVIAQLDRTLLQRAVGNLVSNALAHTPSGKSVVLGTSVESEAVRIEVSDTGAGIPPEALPRVFDRFFRVDESRSQASGGTGLGLAIVQSIMLLHGGKVEIASKVGQGTLVTLRVPVSPAA